MWKAASAAALLKALIACLIGTLLSVAAAVASPLATPNTVAALPPRQTAGIAARLPFVEYEAENAATDGMPIGPDRRFGTIAAEASGRRAIRLQGRGRFVEFTLGQSANALSVRAAIPDSVNGHGRDATLGVYVEGSRIGSLAVTSRYGRFYGRYPFTNRPADGGGHHFFGESRLLLGRTLPAGTKVRIMVGPQDDAPWYVVDLADFEQVSPPLSRPPGSISLADFGADPFGVRSSADATRRAITRARRSGKSVWIPAGQFRIDGHILVDEVTIAGAGPWYSLLTGKDIGFYGRKSPRSSTSVRLRDFAIIGEVKDRNDDRQLAGVGGAIGGGSEISNLFIQHVKVGLWFDGPMDGIRISNVRIVDVTADGLNFHRGVSNAIIENSFVRNSGDDGIAAWSGGVANRNIIIRNNVVIAPILANGIAIYGGSGINITGNLVADTLTQGGGIHVGNRFKAVPVTGKVHIVDNLVVRGGSIDPNWKFGVGALWFYALDAPMAAQVQVTRLAMIDSTAEAIQFIGRDITGVQMDDIQVEGTGSAMIQLRSSGSAGLATVAARNVTGALVLDCHSGFDLQLEGRPVPEPQVDRNCAAAKLPAP